MYTCDCKSVLDREPTKCQHCEKPYCEYCILTNEDSQMTGPYYCPHCGECVVDTGTSDCESPTRIMPTRSSELWLLAEANAKKDPKNARIWQMIAKAFSARDLFLTGFWLGLLAEKLTSAGEPSWIAYPEVTEMYRLINESRKQLISEIRG